MSEQLTADQVACESGEQPPADLKPWNALRPDAQAFDEVRIVTVPRFKESYLSGDEWRISAEIQLWRKGTMEFSQGFRNVETACAALGYVWMTAIDNGKAYYAGDGVTCDQEGCKEQAAVRYRMKHEYCREGHPSTPHRPTYRHFCARHMDRGDSSLNDGMHNYEEVPRHG